MKTIFTVLFFAGASTMSFSQTTPPCNDVVPDFSWELAPAGGGIQFKDASKVSGETITYSCSWDFGAGIGSKEQNPFFSCKPNKTYHVQLKVVDNHGCSATIDKDVSFSIEK